VLFAATCRSTLKSSVMDGVLRNGQKVSLPKGQAVLWMSYGYDLYGMAAGESQIAVKHFKR
jgi:hypothetical protein